MSYKYPHAWELLRTVNDYCDRGYHRGQYKCKYKGCGSWTYGDPVPDNKKVTPPKPPGVCAVAKKPRKKSRKNSNKTAKTNKTNIATSPIGKSSRRRSGSVAGGNKRRKNKRSKNKRR